MSEQKKWVKELYGAIAANAEQGCCGSACGCDSTAAASAAIGYTAEELAAVPQGANLGLGCGNPLALASIKPGETVLDLGSGAGFDAFLAAARVGPTGRVIGVDMTPAMVEKARVNAAQGGYSNVEFRLGDIENLPVADSSVDLVISNCVLNLVPDKPKAFRELVRVLKPGGRVAISDIVLEKPLPESLQKIAAAYTGCISGAIGRAEYLRGLESAGLIDVRIVSEADATALLSGSCCGSDIEIEDGMVTSVSVSAYKPAACCSSCG